jgi:hypothetical protein
MLVTFRFSDHHSTLISSKTSPDFGVTPLSIH